MHVFEAELELAEPQGSGEQPVLPDIAEQWRIIGIGLGHVAFSKPGKYVLAHGVEAVVECEIHAVHLHSGCVGCGWVVAKRNNRGRIPVPRAC